MKTSKDYLEKYANQIRIKRYPNMPRILVDIAMLEPQCGGKAYGTNNIVLPRWLLADKEQAKSTIRHEVAHNIVNWLHLPRVIAHGKEFHRILKQIAPRTWRNDLHWTATEAITAARVKSGIREHKPMIWRWFGCANPGCKLHLKAYTWKRIPSYIQRGLFAKCKYCGNPTLIEFGGKSESFTTSCIPRPWPDNDSKYIGG